MNKKKAPDQTAQSHKRHRNNTTLPPRVERLARSLLSSPLTRKQADRIAPASNGPHYIGLLRHRYGLEIPCDRVNFITFDGEASWYGVYRLTPKDRQKLLEILP